MGTENDSGRLDFWGFVSQGLGTGRGLLGLGTGRRNFMCCVTTCPCLTRNSHAVSRPPDGLINNFLIVYLKGFCCQQKSVCVRMTSSADDYFSSLDLIHKCFLLEVLRLSILPQMPFRLVREEDPMPFRH